MKLKFQPYKLFTWIICACVLFITSCKVDPQEPKTDVSDPNLVSEGINVLNASKKSGNPPASTANAPTASNPLGSTIKVKPGSTAYVAAFFENAQNPVNGFYLQVNGANSYFEGSIPKGKSASNVSGKTPKRFFKKNLKGKDKDGEETGLVSIPIEIPDDFEEGTFCVSYCVVDDEGNVSNVITVCIEITEVGADDTGLFAGENPWNAKKAQFFEDGELYEEIVIGTPLIEIDGCDKYTETIDYFKLTLKANGQYKEAYKAYYKDEDICTNEILDEDTEEYEDNGYWTYNSETNKFFIFYTDDSDNEYDDGYFIEFEVSEITANKLTLQIEDEDFGEDFKFFFER